MARALALVPDLMFGSRLSAALDAAGVEFELVPDAARVRERLAAAGERPWDVLVVDLTDPELAGEELVSALREEGALGRTRTLGFYSHVDAATRERAQHAGFELLVPRSRMAREAAQLVARLSA
jgi:DNA-binding NarL/FixJ family response regulator